VTDFDLRSYDSLFLFVMAQSDRKSLIFCRRQNLYFMAYVVMA